jgi:hypothetical protein
MALTDGFIGKRAHPSSTRMGIQLKQVTPASMKTRRTLGGYEHPRIGEQAVFEFGLELGNPDILPAHVHVVRVAESGGPVDDPRL